MPFIDTLEMHESVYLYNFMLYRIRHGIRAIVMVFLFGEWASDFENIS